MLLNSQLMGEQSKTAAKRCSHDLSPRHTKGAAVLELLPCVWRKSSGRFEHSIKCNRSKGLPEEDRQEGTLLFPTLAPWRSPLQREDTKSSTQAWSALPDLPQNPLWSPKTPTDRPVSMHQTPRTEKQTSRHCSPTLRQQGMRGLELCTVGWERRALSDDTGLSRSPDGVSRPAPPLGRDHCTGGTDMHFNSQLWSVLCGCGTQV